jgi:hypothetical protein
MRLLAVKIMEFGSWQFPIFVMYAIRCKPYTTARRTYSWKPFSWAIAAAGFPKVCTYVDLLEWGLFFSRVWCKPHHVPRLTGRGDIRVLWTLRGVKIKVRLLILICCLYFTRTFTSLWRIWCGIASPLYCPRPSLRMSFFPHVARSWDAIICIDA